MWKCSVKSMNQWAGISSERSDEMHFKFYIQISNLERF